MVEVGGFAVSVEVETSLGFAAAAAAAAVSAAAAVPRAVVGPSAGDPPLRFAVTELHLATTQWPAAVFVAFPSLIGAQAPVVIPLFLTAARASYRHSETVFDRQKRRLEECSCCFLAALPGVPFPYQPSSRRLRPFSRHQSQSLVWSSRKQLPSPPTGGGRHPPWLHRQ